MGTYLHSYALCLCLQTTGDGSIWKGPTVLSLGGPIGGDELWFCRSTAARGRVIGVLVTGLVRYCRTCYVLTHVPADIMING